jgi:beta-phosphoglucomutase-like phosphatase (HAD superfamily)
VEDAIRDIHARKTRHYPAHLEGGISPQARNRPVAEARQRGLRLAIATTTTADNVIGLLHANLSPNADGWFEVIGAGDVVASTKPAPDIYHWVRERLELGPPACLALEDSANGLAASLGAGIGAVVLVNEYARNQAFSGAVAVLFDLGEAGTMWRAGGRRRRA